jgi:hypothetical protein
MVISIISLAANGQSDTYLESDTDIYKREFFDTFFGSALEDTTGFFKKEYALPVYYMLKKKPGEVIRINSFGVRSNNISITAKIGLKRSKIPAEAHTESQYLKYFIKEEYDSLETIYGIMHIEQMVEMDIKEFSKDSSNYIYVYKLDSKKRKKYFAGTQKLSVEMIVKYKLKDRFFLWNNNYDINKQKDEVIEFYFRMMNSREHLVEWPYQH